MLARVEKEMESSGAVELRGILQEGSLNNVMESVFGSRELVLEKKVEELGCMVREGYELIGKVNLGDYFGAIRSWLDFYGVRKRCGELGVKVKRLVGGIVEERKGNGEFIEGENDFLSVLLSLPEEERLSDSDMVAVLWVRTLFSL